MSTKKQKVVFFLPNNDYRTHMHYVVDVANALRSFFIVYIFAEKDRHRNVVSNTLLGFIGIRFVVIVAYALYLRMRGVTIFYIHYSFVSVYAVKIVTWCFGGRVYYWNCGTPWNYKRSGPREYFESRAYRLIDFLVTGSSSLIEGYHSTYKIPKEKIKIIPNWIDTKKINNYIHEHQVPILKKELGLPMDKKIVIFVHKLVPRKGSHYIPAIAESLPDDVCMVILGDGSDAARVRQEIEDRKIGHRVYFRGYVERDMVKKYLRVSDVFVMPSEEEGFPHSLLEAMAFNVPFVVFDVGGVMGMVPENEREFVLPVGNMPEFNKKLNERLKQNQIPEYFHWVSKFDKLAVVKKFAELCNSA